MSGTGHDPGVVDVEVAKSDLQAEVFLMRQKCLTCRDNKGGLITDVIK